MGRQPNVAGSRYIIPHLLTVAGFGRGGRVERGRGGREIQVTVLVLLIATDYLTDACERSSVSKMRFMLLDICMISPLIRHS